MGEPSGLRAYSVKRLAELWDCSPKHIYELIDEGHLRAFSIGKKRGLRVSIEEVERWERENGRSRTETATTSLGDEATGGLPTYAMKILAGV